MLGVSKKELGLQIGLARIFHEYCVKFLKIDDIPIYYTEKITKCSPKVSPYGVIFFTYFCITYSLLLRNAKNFEPDTA
ncbi:MAG: hypothetical protein CSA20_07315 [Deltaproteobacteria bacterium]|nr:MAG: hypothetical protein CSB32_00980 [Desulfobacterales bacterium]PIE72544.1 MAG: hypothetical protein CSA20_07315 [Deltaproteobacteria bacterium]